LDKIIRDKKKVAQRKLDSQECIKCHKTKKITDFTQPLRSCKTCVNAYQNTRINSSIIAYLKVSCNTAKSRTSEKLARGRIEASKYDIDVEYLMTIYEQQEGKCYYSGNIRNLSS